VTVEPLNEPDPRPLRLWEWVAIALLVGLFVAGAVAYH
jgi:hypothetical protein